MTSEHSPSSNDHGAESANEGLHDHYADIFAAMRPGLLVTVNESCDYESGAGEMKVLGSNKGGTVVDFSQGHEVFTAKLEQGDYHLYKRGPEFAEEKHWGQIVTIEVVGIAE